MPPSSLPAAERHAYVPHELGAIDWTGLHVADPTPEPPFPTRPSPTAHDQESCRRSANRFYAQWGE